MGRDRCAAQQRGAPLRRKLGALLRGGAARGAGLSVVGLPGPGILAGRSRAAGCLRAGTKPVRRRGEGGSPGTLRERLLSDAPLPTAAGPGEPGRRSEEHTSELQSLKRISYAVFCLKKKN